MKRFFLLAILLLPSTLYAQASMGIGETHVSLNANAAAAPQTGTSFAVPNSVNLITWIVSFASAPSSHTTVLEMSNDNSIWEVGDTSTNVNGESRTIFTAARFVRVLESARSGGGAITASLVGKNSANPNTPGSTTFDSLNVTNTTTGGRFLAGNGTASAPSYSFTNASDTGFFADATPLIGLSLDGIWRSLFYAGEFRQGSGGYISWSSNANPSIAGADVNISRTAAGTLGIGTGAQGSTAGTLNAATIIGGVFTASVPTTGGYSFLGQGRMKSPSDGVFTFTDAAQTSFGRLNFGGITNAFPSLKRSAATLQVRLGDDSADASLNALDITSTGKFFGDGSSLTGITGASGGISNTGSTTIASDSDAAGSEDIALATSAANRWLVKGGTGYLFANVDATYDIGASGANRPRNVYVGGSIVGSGPVYGSFFDSGSSGTFQYGSLGRISVSSDGVFRLLNNAGTDFTRLQFGGTTSAFPSLARSGTELWALLADGSTFSPLRGSSYTAAASNYLQWFNSSRMTAPSDGVISLFNLATTDFNRLQFGGTSSAFPSIKRSAATLAFRLADDSADAAITAAGITASGNISTAAAGSMYWSGRTVLRAPGIGLFNLANSSEAIGAQIKVDALPTIASGFGTSPSVVAGSTPFAGAVNVGTGGAANGGSITFNGTAFPSTPFCVCSPSLTNVTCKTVPTTTGMAISASAAWSANDIVSYICVSAK